MVSKTKIGATLVGVGVLCGILGNYLLGSPLSVEIISKVIEIIGGVLTVWGIRDIPFLNKIK